MGEVKTQLPEKVEDINKWLDAIIENSFDGIYITDGNANTVKINQAYKKLTGLKDQEVLGYNMEELVRNGTISVSGSLIAIREKRPVTLQQKFKTGKECLITSSPIYNDKGEIIIVVTNVRDLTELLNLREEVEKTQQERRRIERELNLLYEKMCGHTKIIAEDYRSLNTLLLADKVAPLDTTVMLLGETGVGKEVFAQYIYSNSARRGKQYLKVNCGAIPDNLIESELFGYEKGAFTGADKNGKTGLFEIADGGTVFLDEIGELPMSVQVKILRVLQEQEITRIGGTKPVKIDVRIIAATNRNLEEMVKKELFRADLYYRLMVFPIQIPPLRERKKDIIPLASRFLEDLNMKYGFRKKLTPVAVQLLQEYQWPGNIRELRNIIERAVIISRNEDITPESLPIAQNIHAENDIANTKLPDGQDKDLKTILEEMELEYMNQAYDKYGNVREAARSLGMNASTFVRKRKKYQIEKEKRANA